MIPAITEHAEELRRLCLRYHVKRLDLFGSAATGGHLLRPAGIVGATLRKAG